MDTNQSLIEKAATEKLLNSLGCLIDMELKRVSEGLGFTLLIFELSEGEQKVNYVSNANRDDVIQCFKDAIEQLDKSEP